jgi:MoxR-like ATPase
MEIFTPPPRFSFRARMRADFERALLEAAQDRQMREGREGWVVPARKATAKRFVVRRIMVPAYRTLPWALRRRLMRFVCGYPRGWPVAR